LCKATEYGGNNRGNLKMKNAKSPLPSDTKIVIIGFANKTPRQIRPRRMMQTMRKKEGMLGWYLKRFVKF
jgi:hypothetical protein